MAVYNDPVFGEMTYNYLWEKPRYISIFGQTYPIKIAAASFNEKPLTDEQRSAYTGFLKNEKRICSEIETLIIQYIETYFDELSKYWENARLIKTAKELSRVVTPKTLYFKRKGMAVLLLDCVWDPEHGIGVEIFPEQKVASQDIFL